MTIEHKIIAEASTASFLRENPNVKIVSVWQTFKKALLSNGPLHSKNKSLQSATWKCFPYATHPRSFRASTLSTYNFSTLYTTLPHNLIEEKLNDLIEWTFNRECFLYLACNERNFFFTSEKHRNYTLWSCQKVCEALTFLLDNISIIGTKVFRQIVGILMGTNCAPLVADLFLFCYERDFLMSLFEEKLSGYWSFQLDIQIFGRFIKCWS